MEFDLIQKVGGSQPLFEVIDVGSVIGGHATAAEKPDVLADGGLHGDEGVDEVSESFSVTEPGEETDTDVARIGRARSWWGGGEVLEIHPIEDAVDRSGGQGHPRFHESSEEGAWREQAVTMVQRIAECIPASVFPLTGEAVEEAVFALERSDHGGAGGAAQRCCESGEEPGGEEDRIGGSWEGPDPFEELIDFAPLVSVLAEEHGMCELAGGC